jgi:hypothetical protein
VTERKAGIMRLRILCEIVYWRERTVGICRKGCSSTASCSLTGGAAGDDASVCRRVICRQRMRATVVIIVAWALCASVCVFWSCNVNQKMQNSDVINSGRRTKNSDVEENRLFRQFSRPIAKQPTPNRP